MEGMGHAEEHILKLYITVGTVAQETVIGLPAVAGVDQRVVHTGRILRVRLEKIHLALQLRGIRPVVVPFTQGDVLAAGGGIEHLQTQVLALGVEVHVLVKGADQPGIAGGIVLQDGTRAVRGGVVVDQNLHGKIHALHQKAFQRVAQVGLMVIGQAADRYKDFPIHGSLRKAVINILLIIPQGAALFNKKDEPRREAHPEEVQGLYFALM